MIFAAHDLAQWVTLMLTRQSPLDLQELNAEVAFAPEERSVVLNLIANQIAQERVRSVAATAAVGFNCEELCQLLMALSSPLSNAKGNSEILLSSLAAKLVHQVTDLLAQAARNVQPATEEAEGASRCADSARGPSGASRGTRHTLHCFCE